MPNPPSVDEAVARATHAQDKRIAAIRTLAQAHQQLAETRNDGKRQLAELRTRLAAAEADAGKATRRAYTAALTSGWSTVELRRIGLPPPGRPAVTKHAPTPPPDTEPADQQPPDEQAAGPA